MEPTPKPNPVPQTATEDVDLGQFFYKSGNAIHNFFAGLGRLLSGIFNSFLTLLLFLRRNFIWLVLGGLVGIGYGYYLVSKYGTQYKGALTVKTNYNSSRSLYSSVDYFNALISYRHTNELSKILKITPSEAASLTYFEASPLKSELITAQVYQDQLLKNESRSRIRMDTFWMRTINYKDFKASLTKYDYPLHEITVSSTDPSIFPKIQQGIIDKISSIKLLQEARAAGTKNNEATVGLLTSSLKSFDSLRSAYNRRLSNTTASSDTKSSTVMLMEGSITSSFPELQAYDKLLEINDELKNAQNRYVAENDIIQVYSPLPPLGLRESFFEQNVVRYGLAGLIAAFLILTGISLYKFLTKLEKERKAIRQ